MGQQMSLANVHVTNMSQGPLTVFDPRFCSAGPTSLKLVEDTGLLTFKDFTVQDASHNKQFVIAPKLLSWGETRTLRPWAKKWRAQQIIWSMQIDAYRFKIYDAVGKEICKMPQKPGFRRMLSSSCTVTNNATGQPVTVSVKGSRTEGGLFVQDKHGEVCVAKVSHISWPKDNYALEIASGIDPCLVTLMGIVFHETFYHHDQ